MITLRDLSQKLLSENKIALFMHTRPDGDTIGSTLSLYFAIKSKGITVDVYCDDEIPDKFNYLNCKETVKSSIDGTYSALLAVDCADVTRLGAFGEFFSNHKNTYLIDHHVSNTRFAKHCYVVDSASNAENAFDLINEMGVKIDSNIANLLATGIVTDTGNFAHKNVTSSTLSVAARLVELGADLNEIVYNTFKKQSKGRAKLFAKVMSKLRYFLDDSFAVASVFLADLNETGAKSSETEGFIDFIMGIEDVKVGACIMETDVNKYKISFRSKKTDVNAVASVFGGGGHVLASGCQVCGEYEEVVDKITCAVKRFIED